MKLIMELIESGEIQFSLSEEDEKTVIGSCDVATAIRMHKGLGAIISKSLLLQENDQDLLN